jgi:Ni/Fe-hydrogenase 1 B-type cytochrome subunit
MTAGAEPFVRPSAETTRRGREGYRWVYLWAAPIRAMHWIAAICLVVLVATGLFIGRPYFMAPPVAGHSPFLMGWMRFLHFAAAAVLIATGIIRVYWLFAGNRYERWSALFPVRKVDWLNAWLTLKKYFFVDPKRAPHYLGHNPIQQFSYTAIYVLVVLQVVTGFAMYGLSDTAGFFYATFNWVNAALGGAQITRFIHHVATWLFVTFIPVHIYFSIRSDALHRETRLSSMVSGGRLVRDTVVFVDDEEDDSSSTASVG